MLREHNIRFKMSVEPAVIVGNEDLLKSLFMNIIDNGRKAISGQGIIALKAIKNRKRIHSFHSGQWLWNGEK